MTWRLGIAPAALAAVVTLVILVPAAIGLLRSLQVFDPTAMTFVGPMTIDAYRSVLNGHRAGILMLCLRNACAAVGLVFIFCVPVLVAWRYAGEFRLLRLLQATLLLPVLSSASLRLYALRAVLGMPATWLTPEGSDRHRWLADLPFSTTGVVIGLALSHAAFLVLPIVQGLLDVSDHTVLAAKDLGLRGPRGAFHSLCPSTAPHMAFGVLLMTIVAWFSSVEYAVLGKARSLTDVTRDLAGVKEFPEAFALNTIPIVISIAGLLLFARASERIFNRRGVGE